MRNHLATLVLVIGIAVLTNAFFFDRLDRFKKINLPNIFSGFSNFLPGLSSNGIRICINFNSQYPQGYQQNTCFYCDSYRFNQIALYCTGQNTVPLNINYTQANCIMNSCQPMAYQRYPTVQPPNIGGYSPVSFN